jgi:hypothetical protein
MIVPSYHYMVGPASALLALGVILLICRWVFAPPKRTTRPVIRPSRGDYGLLVPVATTRAADDAQALRRRLEAAGIRCTVADGEQPDTWLVLVFRHDADRAEGLVRG